MVAAFAYVPETQAVRDFFSFTWGSERLFLFVDETSNFDQLKRAVRKQTRIPIAFQIFRDGEGKEIQGEPQQSLEALGILPGAALSFSELDHSEPTVSSLFFAAILRQDREEIHAMRQRIPNLVRRLVDLPIPDDGLTFVHHCARLGYDFLLTEFLAQNCISPDRLRGIMRSFLGYYGDSVRMRPEAVAELPQVPSFNTPDHQGLTPLMYALRWGHLETAAVLLPFVDKSSVDNHRRTALHIAVMSGMSIDQAKAIKLLLFNPGIDINAQDDMGRTALHWAAWLGQSDSVVALMAERPGPLPGVDVSIRDNSGYKAECLAKAKNYYKIESLLRSNPRSHAYIRHYQGAPSRISVPLPIRAQLTGQTADRGPSSVRGWDPTESVASTVYVGGDGSVAPESAVGGPGEGSKGPGCRHRVGQALKWALRLDPTRRR